MTDISNTDDTLDVRDLTARVDELRSERDDLESEATDDTNAAQDEALDAQNDWLKEYGPELDALEKFLAQLAGYGGDHNWEGDSYPGHLIHDSYFETYAEEYASDIGAIVPNAVWPNTCIDWKQAAKELQQDFSSAEFDGQTYWYL